MTAMDELRRMLDERGVECHQRYVKYGHSVGWTGSNGYLASAEQWGDALLVQAILTPEQAVDVTMGSDTCELEINTDMTAVKCSRCGYVVPKGANLMSVKYCPGCGRRVL